MRLLPQQDVGLGDDHRTSPKGPSRDILEIFLDLCHITFAFRTVESLLLDIQVDIKPSTCIQRIPV